MRLLISLLLLLPLNQNPALAREVDDAHERDRLLGWGEDQSLRQKFEQSRRNGIEDIEKARKTWDARQEQALLEYRKDKQKRHRQMVEGGVEYAKELKRKEAEDRAWERQRQAMIEERNRSRRKFKVDLTEAEELGLYAKGERVDWEKRNLIGRGGSTGGSAGGFSGGGGGGDDFVPPPPPPPPVGGSPAPEFMDTEIPPPPPPPSNFEFPAPPPPPGFDDNGVPPPPPPPLFDDEF